MLVVGAGAIGGLISARLAEDPDVAVSLAVRRATSGLSLDVDGRVRHADVAIVDEPDTLSELDWVIVATKTYDVGGLAPWLASDAASRACVAVAQNGVEHAERLSPWVPPARVLPMVVTYGAERPSPGRILQTLEGRVRLPASPSGAAFAELSRRSSLAVDLVEDFVSALWVKLAWNLVGNSLTTILDLPVRALGLHPALREVGSALIEECRSVASVHGARLPLQLATEMFETFAAYPGTVHSSMWQDLSVGRRLEHEAISGAVVRIGAASGIDVPYCQMTTRLLEAVEAESLARAR